MLIFHGSLPRHFLESVFFYFNILQQGSELTFAVVPEVVELQLEVSNRRQLRDAKNSMKKTPATYAYLLVPKNCKTKLPNNCRNRYPVLNTECLQVQVGYCT